MQRGLVTAAERSVTNWDNIIIGYKYYRIVPNVHFYFLFCALSFVCANGIDTLLFMQV